MYITKDKFIEKYPIFVDQSEAKIIDCITDAESLIDAYLNDNIVIDPLVIPAIIERIASDLTCYYFQQSNLQAIGEDSHNQIYKNAVSLLEKIANGTIKLTAKQTPEITEETGSVVLISTAGAYEYRD